MSRMRLFAATAVFAVWGSDDLRAADGPPVYSSAFASSPSPTTPAPAGCNSCSRPGLGGYLGRIRGRSSITFQLVPSPCFGYFPTQWHKWEDVCPGPLPPFPPNGSPAGKNGSPADKKAADPLPDPRPVDPKPVDPKPVDPKPVDPKPRDPKMMPGTSLRLLPIPAADPKTLPSPGPQPLTSSGMPGKP